mgnify:CR=1 FL=1
MSILSRLLQCHVKQVVGEIVIKTVDDLLPSLVDEIAVAKFERGPNLELTNAGFGLALSIALRKHWPDLDGETAARWLWDYISTPFGSKGHDWTYSAAKEIAAQYVSEFGERAA